VPVVSKQNLKKPRSSGGDGVLDRIVPVERLTKGMKMLVYGRGKTGKTRLFSTFPKPSLLVGTEDGTNSIADVSGVDFVYLKQSSELDEITKYLRSGKYKSVGLDTAGGLQDMILKEILGLDELPIQRSWGMARQQDWGTVGVQLKERLRGLLTLADEGILDVMVIAHERNFNDEGGSEMLSPTVGAALSPSAAGWLNGACDFVCQTFIREETAAVIQKVAGKEIKQTKKTGKAEYCLRIGPHAVYLTGFRVRKKIGDLPDCITDPDYKKIRSIIDGK
jgi:hypothetical protein